MFFLFFFHFTIFRNYLEKKSETKVIAKTKEIAKAKMIENKEAKIRNYSRTPLSAHSLSAHLLYMHIIARSQAWDLNILHILHMHKFLKSKHIICTPLNA